MFVGLFFVPKRKTVEIPLGDYVEGPLSFNFEAAEAYHRAILEEYENEQIEAAWKQWKA